MQPPRQIRSLQDTLATFGQEREWEQFHAPKNLIMALVGEVGELAEVFQWVTTAESDALASQPEGRRRVEEELADVFGYVLRLAAVLNVDLAAALTSKMDINSAKYPVELAKGNARKYNQLGGAQ